MVSRRAGTGPAGPAEPDGPDGTPRPDLAPGHRPAPDPVAIEEPAWQVLLNAGIWLIFLFAPVTRIITADAGVVITVISLLGVALFAAVYLIAFLHPQPVRRLPRWVNTVGWSLVLLAAGALIFLAAGATVAYLVPYFVALWLFSHDLRTGFVGAGVAVLVGVAAAMAWTTGSDRFWFLVPMTFSVLLITAIRFSLSKDEDARRLREELIRSQQRETVARDVHDVLGHSLTVVAVKTELARRLLATDPDRAAAELDDVLTLARESLAEVRATVGGLRVPALSAQLASARTALDAAGIAARVPGPDAAERVPTAHREVLAWCLREAVTNVVRHSGAQRCTVTLEPGRLVVTDDGVGSDGGAGGRAAERNGGTPGTGLVGLRDRVEQAGGTLSLVPNRPGHARPGARLEVRL